MRKVAVEVAIFYLMNPNVKPPEGFWDELKEGWIDG